MQCFKFTYCGIKLDAKLVVDLLKKEDGSPNKNDVIVADCKEGLKKILRVRIIYYFRKANKSIILEKLTNVLMHFGKGERCFPKILLFFPFPHLTSLFCPNVSTAIQFLLNKVTLA